ncbi:MAG: DUF2007 domain-containing protein [Candidatus Bipolaricaulota bacterium]
MDQWVRLTTVMGEVQANLLAGFLAGEGIKVKFRTHVPPSVYPIIADGLAEVQVMVPAEDLASAQQALAAYHSPEPEEE